MYGFWEAFDKKHFHENDESYDIEPTVSGSMYQQSLYYP